MILESFRIQLGELHLSSERNEDLGVEVDEGELRYRNLAVITNDNKWIIR